MKKFIPFLILGMVVSFTAATAQDFGLSFSYFIPKHGYISTPVSPFSIRGLGKDINRFLSIETGASLYRMSGLAMKDLPLKSEAPFIGPNFTIFVPVELVFQLKGNGIQFDIKGGGFFFYGFDQKLNYGNIDKAIRAYETWQVANADFTFKNKPGFGYHAGAELTFSVTRDVAVSLETNYLVGESKFPLRGSYTGGSSTLETVALDASYEKAKIDFTGLEFSIGLIFSSGGGSPGPKAKKRRRR
jgi:hypothetical protein